MARQTRGQRRARREKQDGAAAEPAATPKRTSRARQQAQVRPSAQPPKQQTGRVREPKQRGRFVRESWGELKKVEWPGRGQVLRAPSSC
jgi:hypothetical protein